MRGPGIARDVSPLFWKSTEYGGPVSPLFRWVKWAFCNVTCLVSWGWSKTGRVVGVVAGPEQLQQGFRWSFSVQRQAQDRLTRQSHRLRPVYLVRTTNEPIGIAVGESGSSLALVSVTS
jgi:hypothetical protein